MLHYDQVHQKWLHMEFQSIIRIKLILESLKSPYTGAAPRTWQDGCIKFFKGKGVIPHPKNSKLYHIFASRSSFLDSKSSFSDWNTPTYRAILHQDGCNAPVAGNWRVQMHPLHPCCRRPCYCWLIWRVAPTIGWNWWVACHPCHHSHEDPVRSRALFRNSEWWAIFHSSVNLISRSVPIEKCGV